MRIALLKPDHGGSGGFERHLDDLRTGLGGRGTTIEIVSFDARTRPDRVYGLPVDGGIREHHDEYFLYLAWLERMDALDVSRFDVVISTQPPTYLVHHPAVVAVFYHQARVFYDLADTFVASGFVDPDLHRLAVEQVQAIDAPRVGGVRRWLVGSGEVADRLDRFWGITGNVSPYRAAPTGGPPAPAPYDPSGAALCVSRHEWPKRTELVVQAAHLDPAGRYEIVGGGSRLAWAHDLDVRLGADRDLVHADDPNATWRNTGPRLLSGEPAKGPGATNLTLHGEVPDRDRDAAYRRAAVVIAPAHREDYGLTVVEAFANHRPVIVCRDGGGLVESVSATEAALVVEPTAAAIAEGVRTLRDDPARARAMAEAAAGEASKLFPPEAAATALVDAIADIAAAG